MGRTFFRKKTKDQVLALLLAPERFDEGVKLVAHKLVGDCLWRVMERDGVRHIQVDVLEKEDGDWGYHSLDEAEHPYHYDCPMSLLRVAGKTTDPTAAVWREQVRKHHAQRRALLSSLETGRTLLFGDKKYRLHSPAGPKRGWYAVLCEDGNLYRLSVDQLSRASFA